MPGYVHFVPLVVVQEGTGGHGGVAVHFRGGACVGVGRLSGVGNGMEWV